MGLPVTAQILLQRPEYSEASIASAASNRAGRLAPNTIVTIYGNNLSFITWAISPQELLNQSLPTTTPREEVAVRIQGRRMPLFYVSPKQINALIPADILPGERSLQVYRELVAGPAVALRIDGEAPEFFQMQGGFVAATHADGRVVNAESPAEAGHVVVIYGTGFGVLRVAEQGVVVPTRPSEVIRSREYRVKIDGVELPAESVLYVGVTPGFAGLSQVNLRLPTTLAENVKIQTGLNENWSSGEVRLFTRKSATP